MSEKSPTIRLSSASLGKLRGDVQVPTYDRGQLRQHTVHLGVGGFHRAHQAVYLDDLLEMEGTERWGECGLGILELDRRMRDILRRQDFLYTVIERSAEEQTARVIGSLVDFVFAPERREATIEKMADAETRIVSLTITEGGYFIDEGSGEFLVNHPDIQHDIEHPGEPFTSLGLMAEALNRRRQRGLPPFTVMSCDNLQGNGHFTSKVLLTYCGLCNSTLQRWISDNVAFPSSMVDRITPATTAADIASLSERFGLEDAWPVVTEPFRQWVIEDTFCNGRPQWERVGAELISDVAPYEMMKIRLLNGSHLALAYMGALQGFTYVHETMQDPLFYSFIESFMEQVTPAVPAIADVSVTDYKSTLRERFANPTINDLVTRVASEGSTKLPKWLLPSVTQLLEEGCPTDLLSLVVASWIFYLGRGVNEQGQPLDIIDVRAVELRKIAKNATIDPRPMLAVRSIFDERLPANPQFVNAVESGLKMLAQSGVAGTMRSYLARNA